ncbi:hypothetical protein X975_07993, partial [Stegodyphus mimosarum]
RYTLKSANYNIVLKYQLRTWPCDKHLAECNTSIKIITYSDNITPCVLFF